LFNIKINSKSLFVTRQNWHGLKRMPLVGYSKPEEMQSLLVPLWKFIVEFWSFNGII